MRIQQTSNRQTPFSATATLIKSGIGLTPPPGEKEVFGLITGLQERLGREIPSNISSMARGAAARKQFQLGTDLVTFTNSPTFRRIKIEDAANQNVTSIFGEGGESRTEGAFNVLAGMIDEIRQ